MFFYKTTAIYKTQEIDNSKTIGVNSIFNQHEIGNNYHVQTMSLKKTNQNNFSQATFGCFTRNTFSSGELCHLYSLNSSAVTQHNHLQNSNRLNFKQHLYAHQIALLQQKLRNEQKLLSMYKNRYILPNADDSALACLRKELYCPFYFNSYN